MNVKCVKELAEAEKRMTAKFAEQELIITKLIEALKQAGIDINDIEL